MTYALIMQWDGSNGDPTGHDEIFCATREAAQERWRFEQSAMTDDDKAAVRHRIVRARGDI